MLFTPATSADPVRSARVRSLGLGRGADPFAERVAHLLAQGTHAPIVAVSAFGDRQYVLAGRGVTPGSLPRFVMPCEAVLFGRALLTSANVREDHRFDAFSATLVAKGIQSFAGVPIHCEDGLVLGTVSVAFDQATRIDDGVVDLLRRAADAMGRHWSERCPNAVDAHLRPDHAQLVVSSVLAATRPKAHHHFAPARTRDITLRLLDRADEVARVSVRRAAREATLILRNELARWEAQVEVRAEDSVPCAQSALRRMLQGAFSLALGSRGALVEVDSVRTGHEVRVQVAYERAAIREDALIRLVRQGEMLRMPATWRERDRVVELCIPA